MINKMDSLVKFTKTLPKYAFGGIIKPRYKAIYFTKTCDSQSCCAKIARDILSLLDKKKNVPNQNERIKEEIWVMLDHEKILSEYNCCALAKLTLEEVLRQMMICKSNEELICYVERVMVEMELKYSLELAPSYHNVDIQALIYKHKGLGMEYLERLHIAKKKDFRF